MTRILRRLLFTSLLFCILFSVPVFAKPSASTVKKAYTTYRSKKGISQYKLIDVDKNGILDMAYCKNERIGLCSYSSKTKKVVLAKVSAVLGKGAAKFYYNKSKHYFGWCTGSTGGGQYSIYKLSGTKATRKIYLVWRNSKGAARPYQKLNGTSISSSRLDQEIQKIWKYGQVEFEKYM